MSAGTGELLGGDKNTLETVTLNILMGLFLTLGLFCGEGEIFMIRTSRFKKKIQPYFYFPQIQQKYLDISKGKPT